MVALMGANPEAGRIIPETGGVRKSAGDWREEASAAARG